MLVFPKWQIMWLESQYCSKNIGNIPLSLQSQNILEDLKTSCCSPNKTIQLEALKCWGMWINNQNPDDWKINTVCFTAVRPLITKKLQPLHKDVDICKMKLSLLWALLLKIENLMHLEGPQYILEVFLQSCLTWLSSSNKDPLENEIPNLIFQLLLAVFKKNETVNEKELFPPLSTDILQSKKVFCRLADKFLSVFIHWRKAVNKKVILNLWKQFLEHCELSCEQIPVPVWHKIFKFAGQICSEKNASVKEKLAFLHSCATTLKSYLFSSKFIDFGNLLTTPSEALLKKLLELCTIECDEFCDPEMFLHSKEISQVLSVQSVALGGYDLCLSLLDALEEFSLKSLFWGVWCGLVYCFKVHLINIDINRFSKTQAKFYRKLRGVAVNFDLDKNFLNEKSRIEVEKHIEVLNISCFCSFNTKNRKSVDCQIPEEVVSYNQIFPRLNSSSELVPLHISKEVVNISPSVIRGNFSTVAICSRPCLLPKKTLFIKTDLIQNILKSVNLNISKSLFNNLFDFRCFNLPVTKLNLNKPLLESVTNNKTNIIMTGSRLKAIAPVSCDAVTPVKKNQRNEKVEVEISVRKTRSKKRAEEEQKKQELESQKRRKRKSYEVIVQEIVQKNKERKTEKNSRRKKSPITKGNKKNNVKKIVNNEKENKPVKVSERQSRKTSVETPCKKGKKPSKADGKLENYFKVITKKPINDIKKEEKKTESQKKAKRKAEENTCCKSEKKGGERKGGIGWRQTSLKSMINLNNKPDKGRKLRPRKKTAEILDVKRKRRKENEKIVESSLAKLSPFKEVLHDHEYARIEQEELVNFEKVLLAKKNISADDEFTEKHQKEAEVLKIEAEKEKTFETQKLEKSHEERNESCDKVQPVTHPKADSDCIETEKEQQSNSTAKDSEMELSLCIDRTLQDCLSKETTTVNTSPDIKLLTEDVLPTSEDTTESETKCRKRVKVFDSLKQSKKIKLEHPEDEKLPLEITEKENLEGSQLDMISTPTKKIVAEPNRNDDSPKTLNRMISSRALRMIALVPESTKTSQLQWESSRVEVSKSKKAPNVDKNSRASKMLALLSENVVEIEAENLKIDEVISCAPEMLSSTPKTPVSSLKSPKSIKKRRSIRFDDAKNETVLYQTNTPPSQILEEKEKCRRMKPFDLVLMD